MNLTNRHYGVQVELQSQRSIAWFRFKRHALDFMRREASRFKLTQLFV